MVLTTIEEQQVNTAVITVLPPRGGSFFTGPNGQANATNLFSTSVQVPSTLPTTPTTLPAIVTDNRITQESVPSFACAPGYFCYGLSSDISIDDAAKPPGSKVDFTPYPSGIIAITLRQDAASLTVKNPTPGIFDVRIFYTPTGSPTTIELTGLRDFSADDRHPVRQEPNRQLEGQEGLLRVPDLGPRQRPHELVIVGHR